MAVQDIVLCRPHVDNPDPNARVLDQAIQLSVDVSIGPVNDGIAREIDALCNPHRLNDHPGDARPPIRYAFARTLPDTATVAAFDPDGILTAALAMSRLAHPTSAGFEWSARVSTAADGAFEEATAGFVKGRGAYAFIVSGSRDWLTVADARETATLLAAFSAQAATMQGRVRRALWRHDYAMAIEELDIRWLVIASGLEALVKIQYPRRAGGPGSTRQFKGRTVALANRLGAAWTEANAERAYELRSEIAHGAKVTSNNNDLPLYSAMEELLRGSIKRALLDAPFQTLFADDAAVDAAFPC